MAGAEIDKDRQRAAPALPPRTVEALERHQKQTTEERLLMGSRRPRKWTSLVFVTENGTPIEPSNLRRMVATLAEEADIEGRVTPYDLRHSATTLMAAAGTSADRLADMLGGTKTHGWSSAITGTGTR